MDKGKPTGSRDGFPIMQAVSYHDWIVGNLRKLRTAKIDGYAQMRTDDLPTRDVVPSVAASFSIDRAARGTKMASLDDKAVLLTPTQPLYVAGIRVRRPKDCGSSSVTDPVPQWVQVLWRLPGEAAYKPENRYVFVWNPGKEEQIVWIFRSIDQIAFHIGDPEVQRRLNPADLPVTILLPAESDSAR